MSRDRETVNDIIQAAGDIMLSINQVSFEELAINREKQAAILYFLIVIGEATKRLSFEFRASHPEIDWQSIRVSASQTLLTQQFWGSSKTRRSSKVLHWGDEWD